MHLRKSLLAVCLAGMMVLTACGQTPLSGAQPQEATTRLVYGSGDYTAINPALYEHGEINSLLFAGLTARDKDNKIIPGLAEKWDYDVASHTYTFHLREGIVWHDGAPLTSRDVKFTLDAIMNPANASEIASNYEEIAAIETPDDQTVVLVLIAPNVAMLDYLTIGILPAHLLEGKDLATDAFNQNPVGTGPYQLTAWDFGQSITLQKNENYYLGAPEIDEIIFKIVPDTKARAVQLKSGELDMAQITPQDAALFEQDDAYTVYHMDTSDYRGILYNFNHPLFREHRELPAVLSYAIDRQPLIDAVLLGYGEAAYSPLQKGVYNNSDVEKYEYNPAKSISLLEAAGWKRGTDGTFEQDGTRLSFAINCGEGDQVRIDMANICAQQLREIGVDARVAVNAQTDWADQEAYLIGWGSPFDPDDHTYKVFGSGKSSNFSAYSNLTVDTLLQKARETDVESERQDFYRQFQTTLADDPAYTFLAYVNAIYVTRIPVRGISSETVLGHHGVGIFWNVADWSL